MMMYDTQPSVRCATPGFGLQRLRRKTRRIRPVCDRTERPPRSEVEFRSSGYAGHSGATLALSKHLDREYPNAGFTYVRRLDSTTPCGTPLGCG